ncbi:MAG: hypothetical protein SFV15_08685 [Polyangiaceae bacterium]|nr:hypothetical protein [Polyangiaceae bacterium]
MPWPEIEIPQNTGEQEVDLAIDRAYRAVSNAYAMKRTPRQPRFNVERAFQRAGDAFVADLKVLIQKATQEALRQALAENSAASRQLVLPLDDVEARAPEAVPEAAPAPEPERLSKREQEAVDRLADQVLEYIEAQPGQRLEEISVGMGVSAADLRLPMRLLVRENHLRLVGEESSAAYYAR